MYLIILKKCDIAHKSKYNLNWENQVILLVITYGKKRHYLAVKNCPHYLGESYLLLMETFIV